MDYKGIKGKWSIEERFDKHYDQVCMEINIPEHIEGVATVWSGRDLIDDETRATALLISKAPEMLEMLHLVADVLSDVGKVEFSKRVEKLIKEATELS